MKTNHWEFKGRDPSKAGSARRPSERYAQVPQEFSEHKLWQGIFFYTENTSMCFELGNRLQNEESDNWQKNKNKKQTSEMVKESFNIWAFVVVAFSKIKDTFENISLKIILDWS